jgi:gamma-glutamyltranspeptidase/glutathione hydrolase
MDDPGMAQAYLDKHKAAVQAGDILKQPSLALTLSRLSKFGPDDFYQGQIAREISTDMARNGGFITLDDLRAYKVLPGRYIHFPYRDYEIHTLAAPAGGGLVAKAMMLLAQYEVSNLSERSWALLLAQALALSIESMTDDYYEPDLAQLTNATWAKQNLNRIRLPMLADNDTARSGNVSLQPASTDWLASDSGHTSHFVTADCSGLTLSMTQTLGPLFGAKVATPSLGFPYAATMGGYLRTGRQDPGSRPRTSIAPVIVTKHKQVILALGAAGGIKIPSAIVQVLSRYIDQERNIEDALKLPRVHPASSIDKHHKRQISLQHFQAETTTDGWTPADIVSWQNADFKVTEIDSKASFARIHALQSKDNVFTGAADPDWEGSSLPGLNCPVDDV